MEGEKQNALAYCELALDYYEKGNFEDAIHRFKQAILLDPDNIDYYFYLGNSFYNLNRLKEAIDVYQGILEIYPSNAPANYNIGDAFYALGNIDDAISAYQKAIYIDAHNCDYYFSLALAFHKKGDLRNAILNYKQAILIKPACADYHYYLASAYNDDNQADNARAEYKTAYAIDPDNELNLELQFLHDKTDKTMGLNQGQKKEVSVFFLDIKDYTTISEKLEPDEVHDFLNKLFTPFAKIIKNNGGWIEKYIGDSIMAVFGIQTNYGHSVAAIKSALEILDEVKNLNVIFSEKNIKINIRVGINTGTAVLAKRDNNEVVTGDVVNTASRLEQLAKEGTVLISEYTRNLASEYFEFKKIGHIKVKGKNVSTTIHIVTGKKNPREELVKESNYTGRTSQLKKIEDAFFDIKSQKINHSIIGLKGDLGIGKARLVRELEKNLISKNENVTILKCRPDYFMFDNYIPGSFEYFKYMLKDYFEIVPDNNNRPKIDNELVDIIIANSSKKIDKHIVKIILYHILGIVNNSHIKEEDISNVITSFIKGIASKIFNQYGIPLILHIEYMDWMDIDSVKILADIITNSDSMQPVLIILSYLSSCETPGYLSNNSYFTEIELKPLNKHECNEFIDSMFADNPLDPYIKDIIIQKSEGNPFFIEEFIKSFVINNTAYIPGTIKEIIQTRIDNLVQTIDLLRIASVIGRTVPLNLLEKVFEKIYSDKNNDLTEMLEDAEAKNILSPLKDKKCKEYIFQNILISEVIYLNIVKYNKQLLHRTVAEEILKLYEGNAIKDYYFQLSLHYLNSGEKFKDQAISYLELGAENSVTNNDHNEALIAYNKILKLNITKQKQIDIYKKQIDIYKLINNYNLAFEKCLTIEKELKDPSLPEEYVLTESKKVKIIKDSLLAVKKYDNTLMMKKYDNLTNLPKYSGPNLSLSDNEADVEEITDNYELINSFIKEKLTGILILILVDKKGKIYFDNGNVVHAEIPKFTLKGSDAFYELVLWQEYTAYSLIYETTEHKTIEIPADELMIKAKEYLEEYNSLKDLYPMNMIPKLIGEINPEELEPRELKTVKLIDSKKTLDEIHLNLNIDSCNFLQSVQILHMNMIIDF